MGFSERGVKVTDSNSGRSSRMYFVAVRVRIPERRGACSATCRTIFEIDAFYRDGDGRPVKLDFPFLILPVKTSLLKVGIRQNSHCSGRFELASGGVPLCSLTLLRNFTFALTSASQSDKPSSDLRLRSMDGAYFVSLDWRRRWLFILSPMGSAIRLSSVFQRTRATPE